MMFRSIRRLAILSLSLGVAASSLVAQEQPRDTVYARLIAENTTDSRFVNELVDHLPYSPTIPSPLDFFGTIIGQEGILHYTKEINSYFRALAEASPRVAVRTTGSSEEGREMIEVIVSDDYTIQNLESYRGKLNALADPRDLTEAEAEELIEISKPIYYVTAGLHSPETGSPEMVMELAYRVAVEETKFIESIRRNIILVFTPVVDPDGRDRVVDIYKYRSSHDGVGPNLTYWGKYVAHDNNRDGFGMSLALSRNLLKTFFHWTPQVMLDLHESVPFLYISSGLGPFNEFVDPITIDEWHNMAFEDVSELTKRDMPGAWTHGFYNGWAANYLIWMANTRNSAGRFYETFGNSVPETLEREVGERWRSVEWYRSNPPLEKTMWSLRNNTNFMQTGVLSSLKYMADNRIQFVENFYLKSKRALERGRSEAPYAWVIPQDQKRPLATARLLNLLMDQGLEIHRMTEDLEWGNEDVLCPPVAEGDYVVRLDQPYSTLARVLLDKQTFPEDANPPYDDVGWTLPYMHRVESCRVDEAEILDADMSLLTTDVIPLGSVTSGRGTRYYIVNNTTDDEFYTMRFRLEEIEIHAAEAAFEIDGRQFASGSYVIPVDGNTDNLANVLAVEAAGSGLEVVAIRDLPEDLQLHEVEVPRIGLVHTWVSTPQDGGWWRFAFDTLGVPYTYLSEQDLATADLSELDVLVFPQTYASPTLLVSGHPRVGDPIPWKNTPETPNIGIIDETDDQRAGMGFEGLANLKEFIEGGGLFITEGNSARLPIEMGITQRVSITRPQGLAASGSIYRATVADSLSPIIYGYEENFPVYFSRQPIYSIDDDVENFRTPEWYADALWEQVPRVVLKFADKDLLMSGMLRGKGLEGKPAVIDVPVGEGHVVLFANRPVRRWNTQGAHGLVFNAMLHWNDLDTGWPERPEEEE